MLVCADLYFSGGVAKSSFHGVAAVFRDLDSLLGARTTLNLKIDNFDTWLVAAVKQLGGHSAAVLSMDNPYLRKGIIASAEASTAWLQSGNHGEMTYLEQMSIAKAKPWKAFPFAKSVLVVAFTNCWGHSGSTHPFPVPANNALLGYVSAYARGDDYHTTGHSILANLAQLLGSDIKVEATVDTQAVNERLFATIGGLGVIGSNGLLRLNGQTGTRTFIGCLFVDIELPEVIQMPTVPFTCDSCQHCVDTCPTGAIKSDALIDARQCISYLTMEKGGVLSLQEGKKIDNWLFGCDCCTTSCPSMDNPDMRIPIDLEWLLKSPAAEVRRTIKGNATAYAGVTKLRRNAVVVLKNMQTSRAQSLLDWVGKNTGSDLIKQQIDL